MTDVQEMEGAGAGPSSRKYDCVICNQSAPSIPSRPMGLVVFLQSTSGEPALHATLRICSFHLHPDSSSLVTLLQQSVTLTWPPPDTSLHLFSCSFSFVLWLHSHLTFIIIGLLFHFFLNNCFILLFTQYDFVVNSLLNILFCHVVI